MSSIRLVPRVRHLSPCGTCPLPRRGAGFPPPPPSPKRVLFPQPVPRKLLAFLPAPPAPPVDASAGLAPPISAVRPTCAPPRSRSRLALGGLPADPPPPRTIVVSPSASAPSNEGFESYPRTTGSPSAASSAAGGPADAARPPGRGRRPLGAPLALGGRAPGPRVASDTDLARRASEGPADTGGFSFFPGSSSPGAPRLPHPPHPPAPRAPPPPRTHPDTRARETAPRPARPQTRRRGGGASARSAATAPPCTAPSVRRCGPSS